MRGRVRSTALLGVATIAVAVVATSCAITRPISPIVRGGAAPERPCTLAAVRSCALPYPSDEFTVPDPSTSTGRRVEVPDAVVGAHLVGQLGPGATPAEVFAGADGFASLSPVIFEVEHPVVPSSLPRDGGEVLAVFDVATGERVPIRAEVPSEAARHGQFDTMVVAWPRTRFEHGHTYVARLTDGLRTHDGRALVKPAGLADVDDPATAELRATLEGVEGDRWEDVVSATTFTVRSETNATATLDRMVEIARAEDHPVRNVRTQIPLLFEHTSAVVTGEVRVSDFRDADGVVRVEDGSTGRWVKFLMALPEEPAGPDGAPVAIYGHGLTVAKETMVGTASANAELGVATVGIDIPNHGQRQAGFDGGYLLDLTTPRRFGRLASMPLQGIVDHVSLLGAVRDHFGDLRLTLPELPGRPGQPAPPLDTSRVLYQGTSMGGVLGGAFTGLAPELDGSFLQVAGTGIADIIYHSLLWPFFMRVIPQGASTGDAYALMGAATMLLDPADNVNVIGRARTAGTPTFLVYGVGDGVVPNAATDRLISLLDLPLVGPRLTSSTAGPPSTGGDVPPADGWGVAQIWSSAPVEIQSFGAHIAFAEPRAKRLLQQWVAGRLRATGVQPPG